MSAVKAVVVGDKGIGKSSLCYRISKDAWSEEEIASAESYSNNITFKGKKVNLGLWDTDSAPEADRLRPLSYSGTDVYLVCCSFPNPTKDSIKSRWLPEIERFSPGVPWVLVGLRSDLKEEGDKDPEGFFSSCYGYVEVSAKEGTNIKELVNMTVAAVLEPRPTQPEGGKKRCVLQ